MIGLKRVYDPVSPSDGTRLLVERLWPRGVSKATLHIDAWLKEVAPSTPLRKWFSHDAARVSRGQAAAVEVCLCGSRETAYATKAR